MVQRAYMIEPSGTDEEEISERHPAGHRNEYMKTLPMQPVAPPSPDYILGLEDPHTPPVPQDEDEREPRFAHAHDPDYVPEPVYPKYIPLEDEHVFSAEEQPLPPVDSPTTESPGYITESDPEEDPEEYEDDETEDGLVDYLMDGGDDGDDDDGDSSGDDVDDEDDEDKEEEEEHLAPADSAIVVPIDEPVSPLEGTEPAIPPPSTDITIRARITVWPQASISLPPEAERLARCMAPPAHSSPPHVPSPLLPSSGCPTQIQTLRIASTQALIDAVTAALPSPPLPPLPPSLYIPPPVNHRDKIPESEQPPRKRMCLSTLGSKYEIEESSTARPTRGQGIYYGFVSMVDAEERRQGVRDVGYDIRDTFIGDSSGLSDPSVIMVYHTRPISRHIQHILQLQGTLKFNNSNTHNTTGTRDSFVSRCKAAELASLQRLTVASAQMRDSLQEIRDMRMRREIMTCRAELLSTREKHQRELERPGPS
ncbi:hypothetical protein Tco_1475403 [Tanacetum coccineum]